MISKINNDVVEYCCFFATHSLDSTLVELCACTSDRERSTRAGEAIVTKTRTRTRTRTRVCVNVA